MKRVLLHGVHPSVPSGYGIQCRFLAEALKRLGYEVAVAAFGGCYESYSKWHGITILGTGYRGYGNGTIGINYRRWNADLLLTLGDVWMWTDIDQFKDLNMMCIMPIDCEPLGVMDKQWLGQVSAVAASVHPVGMSEFGARMLKGAGYDAPVIPHATAFKPSDELRDKWREQMHLPPGVFLISKVGVNDDDDRKAFGVTMHAYDRFSRGKNDVAMYLHTEAQVKGKRTPNLVYMAMQLGLNQPGKGQVTFVNQDARLVDGLDDNYMREMYCATDVLDIVTKAEGFGCPSIDALACGTPIIVAANSAMSEKVESAYSWSIGGQPEWAPHHQSGWMTPSISELADAYEDAYHSARSMRIAAAKAGEGWSTRNMQNALEAALKEVFG